MKSFIMLSALPSPLSGIFAHSALRSPLFAIVVRIGLVALIGVIAESTNRIMPAAKASEPSATMARQGPAYLRHRPGPAYGRRPFWQPGNGRMGYPGSGYGFGGYGSWFPGGFYSPPVYGSWYQRPYPYHFDIYRGRNGGNPPMRADAMGQHGQPARDATDIPPQTIP